MTDPALVDSSQSFESLSHLLDPRLLRGLAELGFARPTLVQAKAIPLALEGRDILARARTGSGKTAAYCLPIVQKILQSQNAERTGHSTRALILVPTRELAEQVTKHLAGVIAYCEKDVVVANIAAGTNLSKTLLTETPDVVVATPSKALSALSSKALSLSSLESLVIDEADLILSYGHDADVRKIIGGDYLPKVYQSFLMSATMTKDVEALKGMVLRSPAMLRLEEDEDEAAHLTQYSVHCSEEDKFLLIYVILKLRLVKGKCIIFVNDTDRCYRLKLFLEQFSIKSCVLNAELPLNSRYHIVQEFNKGVYDYIVATDESGMQGEIDAEDVVAATKEAASLETQPEAGEEDEVLPTQPEDVDVVAREGDDDAPKPAADTKATKKSLKRKREAANDSQPIRKKRKSRAPDKEYGVSRGIDFVDVSCVINFDLPPSARAYTHRVGRTARAGKTGIAISFVVPADKWGKNKIVSLPSAKRDEEVFARVEREQGARGSTLREWKFERKQVEAFRYRAGDAMRSVTRAAVKEARMKELKAEILNSDKLKAHFEDNPMDLDFLRHDKTLHPQRIQPHMKHVPSYLLPRIAAVDSSTAVPVGGGEEKLGFVPFNKNGRSGSGRGRGRGRGGRGGGSGRGKKKSDPLKTFRS